MANPQKRALVELAEMSDTDKISTLQYLSVSTDHGSASGWIDSYFQFILLIGTSPPLDVQANSGMAFAVAHIAIECKHCCGDIEDLTCLGMLIYAGVAEGG